ncbi:hypothetical protein [Flavobacterium psychrotolerans]|uniref:Uncharacterized protein n=1 Tax=Flavobacterium psychrotolerans TaxID=2169410 RepID=A0A2U1JGT1_9FLAO|nr:hypothetical protein [Flavobacterium psychrotolerans]PWA04214.1 hypothetical protein DB895_12015 [Flavobacterium psychrotolerans]
MKTSKKVEVSKKHSIADSIEITANIFEINSSESKFTPEEKELFITKQERPIRIKKQNKIIYEKYLTAIITAKIPIEGTVIINGHNNTIGEQNQNLSLVSANEVKTIIEKILLKSGRTDVIFEVNTFDKDLKIFSYDNLFQKDRYYNQTVVINIVA